MPDFGGKKKQKNKKQRYKRRSTKLGFESQSISERTKYYNIQISQCEFVLHICTELCEIYLDVLTVQSQIIMEPVCNNERLLSKSETDKLYHTFHVTEVKT